ncbi:MAG: hypothetical protein QOG23_4654 [Blastocatellia bacterium]|jgi:hypothetical protein|nr:hypothetical protein [Blastocatellia bacterium]
MKRRLPYLVLFLVFATSPPATLRAQYLHPKVTGKETTIRKVVLMPAKVDIVKQSMRGPEGMAAESDLLSARVTQLIAEALAAKHMNAATGVATGEPDAQKTYTLSDLQSRYDALLPKIMKKPKDVKKGRFTLGDEVLNLNLDKSTDAIVFVRGQGQKLSKGKTTFSILTLSLNFPYLMLTIGVVDAHTGDVLVFATPVAIGDATSSDDRPLRKAIEKSLKKLPVSPQ